MWASTDHLRHLWITQGCSHFHLDTLTAQLLSKGGLAIKISISLLPTLGGSSRNSPGARKSVPAMLCLPTTEAILHEGQGHVSPCRHLLCLGSHRKVSWGLKSPVIAGESQACLIYHCSSSRNQVITNSQQIYTLPSFCVVGKNGADMCWCLWVFSPVRVTPPGRYLCTWCLQVSFSVFNPDRSTYLQGPSRGCGGALLEGESSSIK